MGNYRQVMLSSKAPKSRPVSVRQSQRVLANWAFQVTGLQRIRVQARLRGNNLHLLYEGPQYPHQATVVNQTVRSLAEVDLNSLLPADHPPVYQVFLYGRAIGQEHPVWVKQILLNQLAEHLKELALEREVGDRSSATGDATTEHSRLSGLPSNGPDSSAVGVTPLHSGGQNLASEPSDAGIPDHSGWQSPTAGQAARAIVLTNRSLAKQGQADGIARFLSETLGMLGVAVKVKVEVRKRRSDAPEELREDTDSAAIATYPPIDKSRRKRICVYCESSYSPDPSLLAETIAQQLRDLKLEGFRDALIFSQVAGEADPDWTLRIDLTPIDEMLTYLARWGDVTTIERLLNQSLEPLNVQVTCTRKQLSLHVFCQANVPQATAPISPNDPATDPSQKDAIVEAVRSLLDFLAPQGLYAAFVYGAMGSDQKPLWVEWFKLPASEHAALSDSAEELAKQGDMPAVAFLLGRLLNPDLDRQLATGGIRVQLCRRDNFYHVMTDAPICPDQTGVGKAVAHCLRQLSIPTIAGVRVYGRRAGEKHPVWSHAVDFVAHQRLVPQAMPEFAASEQHLRELLVQPPDALQRREEVTSLAWVAEYCRRAVQMVLLRSPLFAPADLPHQVDRRGVTTAVIWGTAGLLFTVFADITTSNTLQLYSSQTSPTAATSTTDKGTTENTATNNGPASLLSPPANGSTSTTIPPTTLPSPAPSVVLPQAPQQDNQGIFNTNSFTDGSLSPSPSPATATQPLLDKPYTPSRKLYTASLENSPYPSFNNPQLDNKLALYYDRVVLSGAPDVLIIGSSRALRGIDPVALQDALAARGYRDVSVFNFGINGATAQFVNLLVQKILLPNQLPKLIIWADGSRAFNSGRIDSTYEALTTSESYRLLMQGKPLLSPGAQAKLPSTTQDNPPVAPSVTTPVLLDIHRSYQEMSQWFDRALSTLSATYPQRDQLKTLLRDKFTATIPAPAKPAAPLLPSALAPEDQTSLLHSDIDGFLSLSVQFNPATYYQQYARVPGDYDNDYRSFRLQGEQTEALQSLATFTRDRNIPLVVVNLPLTTEYLDQSRRNYEQQFLQYMLDTSRTNGFIFRDLSDLWASDNDYFSDPSHLNRYGAYAVAQHIAQDPMIAWDILKSPTPASSLDTNTTQ